MTKRINAWLQTEEGKRWLAERKIEWYEYGWRPKRTFEAWIRYMLQGMFCTTAGTVKNVKI